MFSKAPDEEIDAIEDGNRFTSNNNNQTSAWSPVSIGSFLPHHLAPRNSIRLAVLNSLWGVSSNVNRNAYISGLFLKNCGYGDIRSLTIVPSFVARCP
jgi:hypothetical protein